MAVGRAADTHVLVDFPGFVFFQDRDHNGDDLQSLDVRLHAGVPMTFREITDHLRRPLDAEGTYAVAVNTNGWIKAQVRPLQA